MKYLAIFFLLQSANALGCWRLRASLSVDDNDRIVINQKMDHDRIYSFTKGTHLYHLKMPSSSSKKDFLIEVGVQKKEGIKLSPLHQSKIVVQEGETITGSNKHSSTNETISFKIKVNQI